MDITWLEVRMSVEMVWNGMVYVGVRIEKEGDGGCRRNLDFRKIRLIEVDFRSTELVGFGRWFHDA